MKAIPFPQANKVLKAPPSQRAQIQELIDKVAASGQDVAELQARLDALPLKPEPEVYDLPVWGGAVEGVERCVSCWEPSPKERARIAAGGPVWLWVVGHTHPPLVLDAANPFEASESGPDRPTVAESFRELLDRLTLTEEERRTVEAARIAASPGDEALLAIIDRITATHPVPPEGAEGPVP